jgi:tetratricopeptide (TPR) repeat protein
MTSHLGADAVRAVARGTGRRRDVAHAATCRRCAEDVTMHELLRNVATRRRPGPCPDAGALVRHADGRLGVDEAPLVEEHLTDCLACAADVEGLARMAARAPRARPEAKAVAAARRLARSVLDAARALAVLEAPVAVPLVARSTAAAALSPAALEGLRHLGARRHGMAARTLERAVAGGESAPEVRAALGGLLLLAQRGREALRHLEAAVAARPRLAEYRWQLAQALLLEGRPADAVKHLERVARQPGARRAQARAQAREARRLMRD